MICKSLSGDTSFFVVWFVFFFFYIPTKVATSSLFHSSLFPPPPFLSSTSFSLQISADLPWIATNQDMSSCDETRHPLFCYGCMRQSRWMNGCQEQTTESDTDLAPIMRSPTRRPSCITKTYVQRSKVSSMQPP